MPTTNYVWDPVTDSYLMETDETGATTATYTVEPVQYGRVVSQRREDETTYHHYDGLGSTRELTDEAENVVSTNLYDAWGVNHAPPGAVQSPFRYVGEWGYYFDGETQDNYVRARMYRPAIARWLSRDPIAFFSPLDIYQYAAASPQMNVDPSGLEGENCNCPCFGNFTEIFSMVPRSGETSADVGIQIQLSTAAGGLVSSQCGGFTYPIWWKRRDKVPYPTFVIQHIRISWNMIDCCGNDVTLDKMRRGGTPHGSRSGGKEWEFYEAWQFAPNDDRTRYYNAPAASGYTYDDKYYSVPYSCTIGRIYILGRYTEGVGIIPRPPMEPGNIPIAGPLIPSSETQPPGIAQRWDRHEIFVKWNCCREEQGTAPPQRPEPPLEP